MGAAKAIDKVWRFTYKSWDGKRMESTFIATEAQIEWIIGSTIDFGDALVKGEDTVAVMEPEHFVVVTDDTQLTALFKENGLSTGLSPFSCLDYKQYNEFEVLFGTSCIEGGVVQPEDEKPVEEFKDEETRVITFDITESIVQNDPASASDVEEMERFLLQFELIRPNKDTVHLAQEVEEFGNGDIDCMSVIRRRSDGKTFGYPYTKSRNGDLYLESNGNWQGVQDERSAYVWLPVMPFTITGYTFVGK